MLDRVIKSIASPQTFQGHPGDCIKPLGVLPVSEAEHPVEIAREQLPEFVRGHCSDSDHALPLVPYTEHDVPKSSSRPDHVPSTATAGDRERLEGRPRPQVKLARAAGIAGVLDARSQHRSRTEA